MSRPLTSVVFIALLATLLSACSQPPFVTLKAGPDREMWWLHAEFHPFAQTVRGIPVRNIDPLWCKANEFTPDLIAAEKRGVPLSWAKDLADNHVGYSYQGNLDGTDKTQIALVGVYSRCDGQKGTFLLVADVAHGSLGAVRFLQQYPDGGRFAVLQWSEGNQISIFWCMYCDNGTPPLKWSPEHRQFEWLPVHDEQ